jgi:glycosyltransferase involved in cell wall biosynthesis
MIEIVELNGAGHRLWYVALLLEAAANNGRTTKLLVGHDVLRRPEWQEYIVPLLTRLHTAVEVVTASRTEILKRATDGRARLVIPDGDRWAGSLLRCALTRGRLHGSVLRMRPLREKGFEARVRFIAKTIVWKIVDSLHVGLGVFSLAPVALRRLEIPDPVTFRPPSIDRDAWLQRHGLDPSLRWLLVLGELSERKHVPELIRAFDTEIARRTRWGMVAVGTLNDAARRSLGGRLRIDDDRFHLKEGFVSDADFDSWVALADCAAVLHKNEASSGVLLKCWAAGTDVMVGGARSVVEAARQLGINRREVGTVTSESVLAALSNHARLKGGRQPTSLMLETRTKQFTHALLGLSVEKSES